MPLDEEERRRVQQLAEQLATDSLLNPEQPPSIYLMETVNADPGVDGNDMGTDVTNAFEQRWTGEKWVHTARWDVCVTHLGNEKYWHAVPGAERIQLPFTGEIIWYSSFFEPGDFFEIDGPIVVEVTSR